MRLDRRHAGGLAALAGVLSVDYADRTLVGAMGPTLKSVFGIGNIEIGLLVSIVGVAGALATIPVGVLTDRWNRMRVVTISVGLWTVAMMAVGAATSFVMLFLARLFLGVVTASAGPTIPSLVGDLVRARDRAMGMAWVNSGQLLGTGAAYLLAALATGILSFHWGFWFLAIAGALLVLGLIRVPEPARRGPSGTETVAEARDADDVAVEQVVEMQKVEPAPESIVLTDPAELSLLEASAYAFRVKTDVIVMTARSVADYFYAGLGAFAVIFATEQYGISEQQADLAILALGIGAASGLFGLSRLADLLLSHGVLNARVWIGAMALILAPFALTPALLARSLDVALPWVIMSTFLLVGSGPVLDAIRVDVLAPTLRGRAEAIREVVRSIAEGGAPFLFGTLSAFLAGGGRVGLQLAFLVTLPALLISGLLLLITLRTYGPDIAAALVTSHQSQSVGGDNPTQ